MNHTLDIANYGIAGIDTPDALYDACSRVTQAKFGAEWELIASMLPSPKNGWHVAHGAGMTIDHIERDDLRLIYAACEVAAERSFDQLTTLLLIRRALTAEHFWDATQIAANVGQMYWSNESLAAATACYPYSTTLIQQHAHTLLSLSRRNQLAIDAYRQLERVLTCDTETLDHETDNPTRPICAA